MDEKVGLAVGLLAAGIAWQNGTPVGEGTAIAVLWGLAAIVVAGTVARWRARV